MLFFSNIGYFMEKDAKESRQNFLTNFSSTGRKSKLHQTTENKDRDDNHICFHSKFDKLGISKVRQGRQFQDRQFQVQN